MKIADFVLFPLIISLLTLTVPAISRKLHYEVNPGCRLEDGTDCTTWTNKTLLHIRSESDVDSLHFIWSFQGSPSLLLARTHLDTNLTVDWDRLFDGIPNSLAFEGPQPIYTFSYSLHKIWTFEDPTDSIRIDKVNQSEVVGYDTKDFLWQRQDNRSILNSSCVEVTFLSGQYKDRSLGHDGYLSLTVRARDSDGYSDILPYMLHSSNMSQVDIGLRNIQMNYPESNPDHTRFALTFLLVQEESGEGNSTVDPSMRLENVKSLDDEHTPGVFNTISIRTPVLGSYDQSYLQWKPVSYFGKVRDITNSIDVITYDIRATNVTVENSTSLEDSILWAYYGPRLDSLVLQAVNISFGSEKDGWYNKTPHISWTYMTGFGTPLEDYVSFLVVLVMAVGLGVPLVIIIASSIYFIVKKLAKPKEDLLLGH